MGISSQRKTNNSIFLYLSALILIGLLYKQKSHVGNGFGPQSLASSDLSRSRKPVIAPRIREEIPLLLQELNLTTGAELGVQMGGFASHMLRTWPKCKRYILVDIWAQQESYKDIANVNDAEQENFFKIAQENLKDWKDKTTFLRMKTVDAAKKIRDNSLDFIYVDARHDYCGVKEDMEAWWPKLKVGGILAGHDYLHSEDQALKDSGQDWSVCGDGSVQPGAVKGAVDEFARKHGLTVAVTYKDAPWHSWVTYKYAP